MSRVRLFPGIVALLMALVVGSCASTGTGGAPARAPERRSCIACKAASDCGSYPFCVGGCCRTEDDENPLDP